LSAGARSRTPPPPRRLARSEEAAAIAGARHRSRPPIAVVAPPIVVVAMHASRWFIASRREPFRPIDHHVGATSFGSGARLWRQRSRRVGAGPEQAMSDVPTAPPPGMSAPMTSAPITRAPETSARETAAPLRVAFERSCGDTLRAVLRGQASLFIECAPAAADLVIFGTDEVSYVAGSELYRSFRSKSVCVTESDTPTFRLPGLYAANNRSRLTRSRCRSMSYFISERDRGNPEIRKLIGQTFEKRYLYSFMGGSNSWARKRLFRHLQPRADTVIEATDSYNHWADEDQERLARANQRRRYASVMAASKFALCPRGCGLSSYRLFESMSLGIAPVIISDAWRPVEGVDWSFALFVPERDIPRLDAIVRAHADEWADRGARAAATYREHFAAEAIAATLHRDLRAVLEQMNPAREAIMASAARARAAWREVYWIGYKAAKQAVLLGFHVTGLSVPVKLHQPVEEQLRNAALIAPRRDAPRP
jgi:hypothetical protein